MLKLLINERDNNIVTFPSILEQHWALALIYSLLLDSADELSAITFQTLATLKLYRHFYKLKTTNGKSMPTTKPRILLFFSFDSPKLNMCKIIPICCSSFLHS